MKSLNAKKESGAKSAKHSEPAQRARRAGKTRGHTLETEFTDRCDCDVIHEDVVASVKGSMPSAQNLVTLAEAFKVFGDPTRVRILCALRQSEMCVCDIAYLLGMTKSAISHQLRVLRQAHLVKYRKDGKSVYYSLDDEHVGAIIDMGTAHIEHTG